MKESDRKILKKKVLDSLEKIMNYNEVITTIRNNAEPFYSFAEESCTQLLSLMQDFTTAKTHIDLYNELVPETSEFNGIRQTLENMSRTIQSVYSRLKKSATISRKDAQKMMEKGLEESISTLEITRSLLEDDSKGLDSIAYEAVFSFCLQAAESRGMIKLFFQDYRGNAPKELSESESKINKAIEYFKEKLKSYRSEE